jgi:hypothetical protein
MNGDTPQPPPPPPPAASGPSPAPQPPTNWWPAAIFGIAVVGLIAFLLSLRSFEKGASNVAKEAANIAEKFTQGTITTTFTAAIPKISSTGMGNLELATAESVETFTQSDIKTVAWGIYLGTTTTEIKVPVTYRYHLRLSDTWKLDVSNQMCIVVAPNIRPSLPPAIHTDKMERRSDRGWARFNTSEQMEELEKSITPELTRMAGDPRHRALAREQCRKTVAEFVKNWLLKEDQWRTDRFRAIKVIFADEVGAPDEKLPTLRIE